MNDSVKLHKILQIIQEEYTNIFNGANNSETKFIYESLDGEDVDAKEVLKAIEPIYRKIMWIVQKSHKRTPKRKVKDKQW